ncbi:hypothetical protein BKA70DRAFT_1189443 [Coprinopsis sp. MPI-PUGE-AT-0042]|nr:hypothetical protein BKA70DRAFT_1189443 [Coprinopsis sp. MPI-PUGE-AT-0042]
MSEPIRTRWVVLDGNSTAFDFTGEWTTESDEFAHLTTLWTTKNTSGSSMRFSFNGTEIAVFGKARSGSGDASPTFSCTVDSTPITPDDKTEESSTNENFGCRWQGSERTNDGRPHTFQLVVSIPEESTTQPPSFSIDSVWYLPSPDSGPVDDPQGLVEYKPNDPHIDCSGNWEPFKDGGNSSYATEVGSSATILFTGTKVIWLGWTPDFSSLSTNWSRANATYWIDSGEPVTFNLDHPSASVNPLVDGLKLFEVDGLSPAAHSLTVVYNGPSDALVLDRLLVQDGNFVIGERPTLSLRRPSRSVPVGAIAGGIVGGLAFITLVLLAWFLVRRRRKTRDTPSSPTPSNDTEFQKDWMALQRTNIGDGPVSGSPTTIPAHSMPHAHSVATSQGDVNLAGRDVHVHKHYHQLNSGTWPDNAATGAIDGAPANDYWLPDPEHYHLVDQPPANQLALQNHRLAPVGEPRSLR